MECPYANKCYCYRFKEDITTGNHNKNISIYISSFKMKLHGLPFFFGLSRIIFAASIQKTEHTYYLPPKPSLHRQRPFPLSQTSSTVPASSQLQSGSIKYVQIIRAQCIIYKAGNTKGVLYLFHT